MPPSKKIDLDKLAWAWVEGVLPTDIQKVHLESAYRIGLKACKNCKRNCTNNPQCLTGIGEEKYMKSQLVEVASLESSLSELRDPTEYVGLKNLGATCYVNSLIQMWFHNEDMRRIIYKWNITEDPEEREAECQAQMAGLPFHPVTAVGQLQYIFAMMQFGNRRLLDPMNLAVALSLDTRTQQDAQEFSKLLLCHIEGKLQQNAALRQMLQRLTQGKYSYINCCSTCGTEYPTSTTFYELDLQLAATIKEAIEKYLSVEHLTGANQYHCVTCNDKKDARRFIRLESLPETLNIQLMRFVFHRDAGQKRKLNSFIQFPEILDMSEYVRCSPQTQVYGLVAVLSHKGPSAHSGHYIANICNSNGEWYQFSDDKVEKMQNKRIEDSVTETTTKAVKRGRVPKGFLSSNTAYMLVYKKVAMDGRMNNGKKSKLRKVEVETNSHNSETHSDKEKADSSDEGKRKNGPDSILLNSGTAMKMLKLDVEKKTECEDPVSPSEILDSTSNGKDYEADNKENHYEIKSSTKVDYKRLNGAAHRAMSCGERDFYEEMEFESWEVSSTLRDLVRQENVKHELSLLAIQQEKQKEIEDQNLKRQLVIDIYNIIASTVSWDRYQWVPSDWLSKWLNGHAFTEGVPPIDNSILLCPHFRLDPLKVNRAKCLPLTAAELIYDKYRGGPRLDENSLCEVCVRRRYKLLRFKISLERDYKEVTELTRTFKEPAEESYVVGADSWRSWRRLAMEKFLDDLEHEIRDEDGQPSNEPEEDSKSSSKESEGSKDVEESEENEAILYFNEDLLCEHGSLKTPVSSRKVVPKEAWVILRKYFPESKEYTTVSSVCSICEEKMENAQKAKKDDKIKAKHQKDELNDLYHGRNKNEIQRCEDPEKLFYIVEKGFLDSWRSFVRYAEVFSKAPPIGIRNGVLLCVQHRGFLYPPTTNNEMYSIVTAEEWSKLIQFYDVDYTIAIKKNGPEFCTSPGLCAACMLARVERERLESLKYDRATIYVKCVDDHDGSKSETDTEVAAKRPKMDSARPSRTRRNLKGSHELKVSSEITLKDLKLMKIGEYFEVMNSLANFRLSEHLVGDHILKDMKLMTMRICGAGPYDQHLMLGEHELTDHSQSLAALGIFPGALLTLKIDAPIENEADVEADADHLESPAPEKGFKGTELVPS